MTDISLKKLQVEKGADRYALTARVLRNLPRVPMERVTAEKEGVNAPTLNMDKEILRLISFPGQLLKPCPGTKGYICCGYQILNIGTNCPLNCSYCILQAYFNQSALRVFVNLPDQLDHLAEKMDALPEKIFRIGTGEFTDSLALDPITGWSDLLLPFFSKRDNAVLELKTKTDNVKRLLASPFRDRIIVSWSLYSPSIGAREEKGAPGIEKRLRAARRCQEEGFTLGFHFDPLIEHPDWKEEYLKTIEMLAKTINPKGVIWISMGCFRYMPFLKNMIRKRHPETHILDGEFISGLDGKMRYFKPIRIDMYGFMAEKLSEWYQGLGLYLCMESHEVWSKGLGWSPENSLGLTDYLDKKVRGFFIK